MIARLFLWDTIGCKKKAADNQRLRGLTKRVRLTYSINDSLESSRMIHG